MAGKTKGLNEVLANLNKQIMNIENGTMEGILQAAMLIEGESVEMTPVDQGPLRASAFVDSDRSTLTARIGYTAEYAAWVHEMPMKLKGQPRAHFGRTGNQSKFGPRQVVDFGGGSGRGRYWDSGENKFLEKAVKNNMGEVLEIIKRSAKLAK